MDKSSCNLSAYDTYRQDRSRQSHGGINIGNICVVTQLILCTFIPKLATANIVSEVECVYRTLVI